VTTACEDRADVTGPDPTRSILVAIDGSRHAAAAVEQATAIAARDGARMTLIHVLARPHVTLVAGPYIPPPLPVFNEQEAEALLEQLADAVAEGIPVHTIVRPGNPADEILKRAEGSQHDLIVIGSRGHGAAASMLLGSVSRAVVHRSEVPVLVVHVDQDGTATTTLHERPPG
jgi:nucleotide-binding universal stress UspA family protein